MKNERLYTLLDITSLGDLDSHLSIVDWTGRIGKVCRETEGRFMPAAICVFAPLLSAALEGIGDLPISLAAVTGNFPSGKATVQMKSIETLNAIDAGANEIDWVIDRGAAIYSNGESIFQEVQAARQACGFATLKVIFETGQIENEKLLYTMACNALDSGADFLKTSTGKIQVGATEMAATILCTAIKDKKPGAGFKASGGIRNQETAFRYLEIYETILGKPAIPSTFRIGASTLAIELADSEGIFC